MTSSRTVVEPRHRSVMALLVTAVFLTASLSGCISLDFFLPQKATAEEIPDGNGLVRLWVAVQPGALGSEFVRYNVTFGPSLHIQDVFGQNRAPMNSTMPTVDLVHLEKHKKATAIAGLIVRPGTYYGYTFQTTNASLTHSTVVGNDNGEEVLDYDERPIGVNELMAEVQLQHQVFADSVTDIFIEIDMRRSLVEEKGEFQHATVLAGTSIYINGHKAHDDRYQQRQNNDPVSKLVDPYGARWNDISKFSPPVTRFEVHDAHHGGKIYDSLKENKHHTKVIGLGQELTFSSRSYSSVFEQGVQGRVTEILWNFGDGTTAAGGTVTHNWTSGGLYDVTLSVRDEFDLVGRIHGTFIVPYRADEAVERQEDARVGRILLGNGAVPATGDHHKAAESFQFPDDLENGELRLGAYRIGVRFSEPTGGLGSAGTVMRMHVDSGRLQTTVNGTSPLLVESAGLSVWWPGPTPWVDDDLQVELELVTGAYVSYELTVEALYFENMTRGYDSHAGHRHGKWPFGPDMRTVSWNGTAVPPSEE